MTNPLTASEIAALDEPKALTVSEITRLDEIYTEDGWASPRLMYIIGTNWPRIKAALSRGAGEWIPVTKRLPETCKDVQCYCEEPGMAGWQGIGYLKNTSVPNDWNVENTHANEVDVYVSHWQPLPSPPKAEEQKNG